MHKLLSHNTLIYKNQYGKLYMRITMIVMMICPLFEQRAGNAISINKNDLNFIFSSCVLKDILQLIIAFIDQFNKTLWYINCFTIVKIYNYEKN